MSLRDTIVARSDELAAAGSSGNWLAAADMYTDDATLMVPDGEVIRGRVGIENFWKQCADVGVSDFAYTNWEEFECGNRAIDINALTFSLFEEDGSRTRLNGKAIVIWQEGKDGNWRLFRDIWNMTPLG